MSALTPDDLDLDPGKSREDVLAEAQAWEEQERLLAEARASTVEARAAAQVRAEDWSLADELRDRMRKRTKANLIAARKPWPHLFRLDKTAAFPRSEVAIFGAAGREGKTSALVAAAVGGALGNDFGCLPVESGPFSTVIFSAEDSVEQYDAKLDAQLSRLSDRDQETVLDRVRVIDLDGVLEQFGSIVVNVMGKVQRNEQLVAAIIDAVRQPVDGNYIDGEWDAPLGLIILETVSTLSAAEEDTTGLKVFAAAAKTIARQLGVAVVLVHHTSQMSALNLPTLNISQADIRGATALVYDTRQTWMLVNLGEEQEAFPDKDARTQLRKMIAPGRSERISAVICLDSSKSIGPAPAFYAWDGMRQVPVEPPLELKGVRWRQLHRQIGKARAEAVEDEKADAHLVELRRVSAAVGLLDESGMQPTITAVATRLGRGKSWAAPRLAQAVAHGLIRSVEEPVPRQSGPCTVYRPLKEEE